MLITSHNTFHSQNPNASQRQLGRNVWCSVITLLLIMTITTVASAQRVVWGDLMKTPKTNPVASMRSGLAKDASVSGSNLKTFAVQLAENNSSPTKKAIVGSWMETVTISVPGNPSFQSLSTYTEDGGLVVMDAGNVNVAAGTVYSAGHGCWVAREGRTIDWTVMELVSDLNGNLIGTLKVRGRYTIDESGNSYTGNFLAEQVDTNGALVFSVEGTNEGHRIQVEPLL